MRAVWTGSISFGLVDIPIRMYSGSRTRKDHDPGMLQGDDARKTDATTAGSIEIKQFVEEPEIDNRYYARPYYLEPMNGAERAYALLREALRRSEKVALAKFAVNGSDHMGAIKPIGNALVLNGMRFPADIRETGDLKFPPASKTTEDEILLALALIDQRAMSFIPEDWQDDNIGVPGETSENEDEEVKHKPHAVSFKDTKTPDLVATLKASLKM